MQKIKFTEVLDGTRLRGLAPIGVRWHATKRKGRVVPDKGCPRSEFALTEAWVAGQWVEVET